MKIDTEGIIKIEEVEVEEGDLTVRKGFQIIP